MKTLILISLLFAGILHANDLAVNLNQTLINNKITPALKKFLINDLKVISLAKLKGFDSDSKLSFNDDFIFLGSKLLSFPIKNILIKTKNPEDFVNAYIDDLLQLKLNENTEFMLNLEGVKGEIPYPSISIILTPKANKSFEVDLQISFKKINFEIDKVGFEEKDLIKNQKVRTQTDNTSSELMSTSERIKEITSNISRANNFKIELNNQNFIISENFQFFLSLDVSINENNKLNIISSKISSSITDADSFLANTILKFDADRLADLEFSLNTISIDGNGNLVLKKNIREGSGDALKEIIENSLFPLATEAIAKAIPKLLNEKLLNNLSLNFAKKLTSFSNKKLLPEIDLQFYNSDFLNVFKVKLDDFKFYKVKDGKQNEFGIGLTFNNKLIDCENNISILDKDIDCSGEAFNEIAPTPFNNDLQIQLSNKFLFASINQGVDFFINNLKSVNSFLAQKNAKNDELFSIENNNISFLGSNTKENSISLNIPVLIDVDAFRNYAQNIVDQKCTLSSMLSITNPLVPVLPIFIIGICEWAKTFTDDSLSRKSTFENKVKIDFPLKVFISKNEVTVELPNRANFLESLDNIKLKNLSDSVLRIYWYLEKFLNLEVPEVLEGKYSGYVFDLLILKLLDSGDFTFLKESSGNYKYFYTLEHDFPLNLLGANLSKLVTFKDISMDKSGNPLMRLDLHFYEIFSFVNNHFEKEKKQ
jgi:hypothetical protein